MSDRPNSIISATTLRDCTVRNATGEDLGSIEDVVLDTDHNRIAYAVLSFGGFLGLGDKYFAVPWEALDVEDDDCCRLNVAKERLEAAEGFDKSNWPTFADRSWGRGIYTHYGISPYWD